MHLKKKSINKSYAIHFCNPDNYIYRDKILFLHLFRKYDGEIYAKKNKYDSV